MTSHIIAFQSRQNSLNLVGGKGANLIRLTNAGFNVPDGFIISTTAYTEFVVSNHLDHAIQDALSLVSLDDAASLDQASRSIRAAFNAGEISASLKTPILDAFSVNQNVPVAVRSSATAEDLPDLSFAGQQDTYLNVVGEEQLIQAVVNCWSSLWTARAIGYRMRNKIDQVDTTLAVVVQIMVQSEVSGVLFTANPLTGSLRELVIDATFGLGEALVSGQVEPDHFVVDSQTGKIIHQTTGAKQTATRVHSGGGVDALPVTDPNQICLTEKQISQLADAGRRIQQEYGQPQDIEWAFADGSLYILQARAITSLFPVPVVSFDPLIVWFSFGSIQGVVGPMTPQGLETIQWVANGATLMFDKNANKPQTFMVVAGERLWIKCSDLIRNPIGNKFIRFVLESIDPGSGQIIKRLVPEPGLGAGQGKINLATVRRVLGFILPVAGRAIGTMLNPTKARAEFDAVVEKQIQSTLIPPASDRSGRLNNIIHCINDSDHLANALPFILPRFLSIFAPAMGSFNYLMKTTGDPNLVLEITRGMPNNVTTRMDLALWETAREIRTDKALQDYFMQTEASDLSNQFLIGSLPDTAQDAISHFLNQYGMRGVGEIDFGQPRWRENPTPVMHTLKSYMEIDPGQAPDVLFERGHQAALKAIEELATRARSQSFGWFKEKLVRGAATRVRLLLGARESPKFYAIRTMGIIRKALLDIGQEFVQTGTIQQRDDLLFLRMEELEQLARDPSSQDWKHIIQARRKVFEREYRRRQVPRVLVSDGRAFYEGLGIDAEDSESISGSPVSPGMVEGIVHIVLDPRTTQLARGEILVCPGTDPAWTPLFLMAGGLITEVGGMMTHGSVVAREYGIPAVVGVHQATTRLKDGQRIRVDGTSGKIVVL